MQVLYQFIFYFSGKKAQRLPRHAPKSNPSMCLNISRWLKLLLVGIWYEQQKASRLISFLAKNVSADKVQLHWFVLRPFNGPTFDDIVNLKLLSIPISEALTNVGVSNC